MASEQYAVAADIGGTNARFCRVELNSLTIDQIQILPCANYQGIEDAWIHYLNCCKVEDIKQAAIAIACPVSSDTISMTNSHWQFSANSVKQKLGLNHLYILNDFTATAMSLTVLQSLHKLQIGGGYSEPHQNMLVLGAGTGLGVAQLIRGSQGYLPVAGEGGMLTGQSRLNRSGSFINICPENTDMSPVSVFYQEEGLKIFIRLWQCFKTKPLSFGLLLKSHN